MNCKKPCDSCPFSRASTPGGLGTKEGPEPFIGQAHGPFYLPCHKTYLSKGISPMTPGLPQCAGAAIFRANIGVAPYLPLSIHVLPRDSVAVFKTPVEFLAHHARITEADARAWLAKRPPSMLMGIELSHQKLRSM